MSCTKISIKLNIAPYLIAILLFVLTNFSIYQFFFQNLQEKLDVILTNSTDNIESLLVYEFRTILQQEYITDSLFFFKRFPKLNVKTYKTNDNDKTLNQHINVEDFTLYVIKPKEELMLDPRKLTIFLHNTFPSYIDYQININKYTIAQSKNYTGSFTIQKNYKVSENDDLSIKLNFNKEDEIYIKIKKDTYKKITLIFGISFIIYFGILYAYLYKQKHINSKIIKLSNELAETTERLTNELNNTSKLLATKANKAEKQKDALLLTKRIEHILKQMFIRHATAIYLDNNIPNTDTEKKPINELSNFLFPLVFTEPVNNEDIEIDQIIKDLTGYTAFEATKYEIRFDKQVDTMKVQCSEAVFYQILFSLISNLILMMPKVPNDGLQTEPKKKFTVTFLEEKIIIDFETFPLNAQQIASFADKKMPVDAFFLDYKRVLESMQIHNIDYCVTAGKTGNRYELDFRKKIPKGKPELRLVE